jgi:hypothetical protein
LVTPVPGILPELLTFVSIDAAGLGRKNFESKGSCLFREIEDCRGNTPTGFFLPEWKLWGRKVVPVEWNVSLFSA